MTKFQIIIFEGEYNDKIFRERFITLNKNPEFDEYCIKIKNKLNKKYRETLLESEVIWTEKDDFSSYWSSENLEEKPTEEIQKFFENFSTESEFEGFQLIKQFSGLKYIQKVKNRWDERGDGRPDIEYDEITYFKGKITIYFFDHS